MVNNKILNGIRVLEIGSDRCAFCGKLLADLGAEVIKIEPPGGDNTRRIPPFCEAAEISERSLFHAFFNAGKKSVLLDICDSNNYETLLNLIKNADVMIEAEKPGYLAQYGFSYEQLKKVNPGIILCSVTPYGQYGPWAQWEAASDMIIYGAAGAMYELGDCDKPPIQMGYHFLTNGANLYALTGVMAAINARDITGRGTHVDVSVFEVAAAWRGSEFGFTQQAPLYKVCERKGSQGIMIPANFYDCKDGHAFIMASGKWPEMISWMKELGMDIRGKDDPKYLPDQGFNRYLWEEIDEINGMVNELTKHYTMKELVEEGQKRKIPVGPAETMKTVLENEQYNAREYFREIQNNSIGTAKYPARAFCFTEGNMCTDTPAPKLGEHTEEVLRTIKTANEKPNTAISSSPIECKENKAPLEGVVVLDLGWVVAGPHCGRVLRDLGATVIRIESASRLDPMRIDARRYGLSEKDSLQEGGWCFQDNNRNKLGLGINLKTAEGQQIFHELVKKADIIICNFAPRGFHKMGLAFEDLKQWKEDIIVLNASGLGDYGPYSSYMTFAPVLSCYTGLTSLIGYEGKEPYGYPGPFADYTGGISMAAAVLAAYYYRNRTGKGQFIDLCQAEATIQNMGPQILDYQLNGRIPKMYGNHDTYGIMAPHNCYECKTDNTWIVLAVQNDEQWNRFVKKYSALVPELDREEFSTADGRLLHQTELDELISGLFRRFEAKDLAVEIQEIGVSASKVHSTKDTLYDNEQIKALDYFKRIDLPLNGLEPEYLLVTGPLIHMEGCEEHTFIQGPGFGKDNEFILKEMLGHDDSFYQKCVSENVFS